MEKTTIGLLEEVTLKGDDTHKKLTARVDTGAEKSSMDMALAAELQLGPIEKVIKIKSSHGETMRPMVRAAIVIKGKEVEALFTLANRRRLKYDILIGQNVLKDNGFLIDPDL